ncbi:MAG: cellulase family glycosylhydrolase, partial [Flavobacteriales bacterium]
GVVANRYQHLDPDRVMFELLNEPTLLFSKDSLLIMYNDAIDSIRQHTVDHSIIVGSHYGSTAMVIPQFEPLADTNLIYTWHTYDPLDFTHQGLTWHNPFFPAGNPFPNADTSLFEHWVYDGWQNILEWRQTHNKPIFIGEFGLDTYCDSLSSCNWLDYHMTRVVQNDISWFYWDWQWDFSMFNSHVISEDSIYPCHKYYLGLYGDDTFTNVENTEFKNEIGVNLYPNPSASGKFTLELDFGNSNAYNIEVYSNLGRLLYSQTFYGNKYLFEEALNPGFYLVNVETERGQTTKKFIVN